MTMQPIETQATILNVTDDAKWKYSIEADIPAFDGDRSYRYLAWAKKQGPPPQEGATVLATFEPYQRAKYYIGRGDIEDGPVDGTEKHFQITWNLIAARPVEAVNGAGVAPSTGTPQETPVRATSDAPQTPGTTYLAAPTTDERMAKEIQKFRREIEGVNDRKAVSDILAMVEAGTYTLDGLIEDAEKLAAWYNSRMAARCGSPLVQAAQEAGAVITEVIEFNEPDGVPAIINKPALSAWVAEQGWQKDKIATALQDAGYASSAAYLDKPGNTVQGLASLLNERLGW
tara:strand:- start:205 stop:1065 length:861 start_codon:yes stop_codon:yes gene_type:complete